MNTQQEKKDSLLDSYNSIFKHCDKCKLCRVRMEHILQHALDQGDYKDE